MHDASFGLCQMTNKGPDVNDSTSKAVQYSTVDKIMFSFFLVYYHTKEAFIRTKRASCLTMLGTIFYIMIL